MSSLENRIKKLERMQPKGLSALSDQELAAKIACNEQHPEVQQMYADQNDPLHARAVALLKIIGEYEND